MKTVKSILIVLFALSTAQIVSAYYSPSTGRWLSRDPNGEPGFETIRAASTVPEIGQIANSSSARWIDRDSVAIRKDPNRYGFAGNAPIIRVDAFGLTHVESMQWFPGSISDDGLVYRTDVNDGQSGTVELHRVTMANVEAEMRLLVDQLQGYKKRDGCKSRKYEGNFDSRYFAGENQQHQYYLVDGQAPLYADNQINYIGIGLYEAWLCDSLSEAKEIVWGWKILKWHDAPSEGTMKWLEVGYNNYQTLKSADDSCCRCPGDNIATLRSTLHFR